MLTWSTKRGSSWAFVVRTGSHDSATLRTMVRLKANSSSTRLIWEIPRAMTGFRSPVQWRSIRKPRSARINVISESMTSSRTRSRPSEELIISPTPINADSWLRRSISWSFTPISSLFSVSVTRVMSWMAVETIGFPISVSLATTDVSMELTSWICLWSERGSAVCMVMKSPCFDRPLRCLCHA